MAEWETELLRVTPVGSHAVGRLTSTHQPPGSCQPCNKAAIFGGSPWHAVASPIKWMAVT